MPIAELVHDEVLNGSAGAGRLERFERTIHLLNKALKAAQDPAVDFRALGVRHVLLSPLVSVCTGVQGEEIVRVVQGAKEFALDLPNARHVKL